MLRFFNEHWAKVPTCWLDTETTGVKPGRDRAVQVAIVRFENGEPVDSGCCEVNPGIPIPPEATAIHGIDDAMVAKALKIDDFFADARTQRLLEGAQPAAYSAGFDRHFVPPFGEDWTWPWLDSLSLVRVIDRFARGKGRHRLEAACERHGIALPKAHDAEADATAAGRLFYTLVPKLDGCEHARGLRRAEELSLGELLSWQRQQEAIEWFRFNSWLSKQPPLPEASNG